MGIGRTHEAHIGYQRCRNTLGGLRLSSFVRPEAKAAIWRWREVLIGAALIALGALWTLRAVGVLQWVSPLIILAGVALAWIGWQRLRFGTDSGGRGAVEVDEGQITYLGPLSGGSIALREMTRLTLEGAHYPAHWRLEQPGVDPLMIPTNAVQAEALFDAFSSLPGLRTDRLLAALETHQGRSVVVWEKASTLTSLTQT